MTRPKVTVGTTFTIREREDDWEVQWGSQFFRTLPTAAAALKWVQDNVAAQADIERTILVNRIDWEWTTEVGRLVVGALTS